MPCVMRREIARVVLDILAPLVQGSADVHAGEADEFWYCGGSHGTGTLMTLGQVGAVMCFHLVALCPSHRVAGLCYCGGSRGSIDASMTTGQVGV